MNSHRAGKTMRRSLVVLVVALGALITALPTQACVPVGGVHHYSYAQKNSAAQNDGIFADVYIPSSGVTDWQVPIDGFIGGVIWEAVANDTSTNPPNYWVEAGWTHGWEGSSEEIYYWARNNSSGYAEHAVNNQSLTVGSWMPIEISYDGNSIWGVYFNGTRGNSPTGQADISAGEYSRGWTVGIESTSLNNYAGNGIWNELEKEYSGDHWVSGVDSGATLYCDEGSSSWLQQYTELQANF